MNETPDTTTSLPRLTSGSGSNPSPVKAKQERETAENIELSLGLSLNGRFGLEPQRSVAIDSKNKLFRANTVAHFVNFPVDLELTLYSPLTRTCSLPPETEVECRKRKELQSLRRSEAKRRRVEKMKNVRVGLKQPSPAPAAALPVGFSSERSSGSQESGGSSGVSDLDSQPLEGTDTDPRETNEDSKLNNVKCNRERKAKKQRVFYETMPCVSTKKCGPDGKTLQGFLCGYGKGEDVRIVCVCHGSFLTPAEFVKHGGGGDVDHPLRHILVTSMLT